MNRPSQQTPDWQRTEASLPKYERLKSHLLEELAAGRLEAGDALPPELELAGAFGVARNTVRQALSELEREGLIVRVRGKGTFVRENVPRRLRRAAGAFALVVPETRRGFYGSLLHGFEAAANDGYCQAVVCSTGNDLQRQAAAILQLLDREVDGVAIVPTTHPPTPPYQIRPLQKRGTPVVFCHRAIDEIKAPLIAIPFEEVGRLAGQALAEQGHRRVAFFASHQSWATQAYENGLRAVLEAAGGEVPSHLLYCGDSFDPDQALQEPQVLAALRQMCLGPKPPTAIMASFDTLAELIFVLLGTLGIRVPEDVSLIGFGGTWRNGAVLRRLTSVMVDEAELGRKAAALLHEMCDGIRPLDDTERILMPLSINAGATLVPPQ